MIIDWKQENLRLEVVSTIPKHDTQAILLMILIGGWLISMFV